MSWWDRLSNSELRARLEQRGLQPVVVEQLVARREDPSARKRIERELGGSE